MNTTVKHFYSEMPGSPVASGVAGSRIDVLDACLVNGWGITTIDSLSVSGGVGTALVSLGHPFVSDAIVTVAGAAPGSINGERRVLTTSSTSFTFDAAGISDQSATGSITVKYAPAGWEKVFSADGLAVYRSADVEGSRMFVRVDDTGATNMRVSGYEDMTGVSAGTGRFPTSVQVSGGLYWPVANVANTTSRAWTVVADSRTFWMHSHTDATSAGANGSVFGFGDYEKFQSVDPYACAVWGLIQDNSASSSWNEFQADAISAQVANGPYSPRGVGGVGGSAGMKCVAESYVSGAGPSGGTVSQVIPTYPNAAGNSMFFTRKLLVESGVALRGVARGLLLAPQSCHDNFSRLQKIVGTGALTGRKLLAVKCGAPASLVSQGVVFFDITGPWG